MRERGRQRRSKIYNEDVSGESTNKVGNVNSTVRGICVPNLKCDINSTRSQISSPGSSRASSPTSKLNKGKKRNIEVKSSQKKLRNKGACLSTSVGSISCNSYITSNKKSKKRSITKSAKKIGKYYNQTEIKYSDSDYHYGSDFDEDDDNSQCSNNASLSDDSENDDAVIDSDEFEADIDTEFTSNDLNQCVDNTPLPFWLCSENDLPAAKLVLPASSEDLLIQRPLVLRACSVYEVLRHFRLSLRLTPFRVEDFCVALSSDEQSNLMSEIHMALLRAVVRADEKDQCMFGPVDSKDSSNAMFFFMDSLTWPSCLVSYMNARLDSVVDANVLNILATSEYPFSTTASQRLDVLCTLCDLFIMTNVVRDEIVSEGVQPYEEHCRICHRNGDLVVCESCSGAYHPSCMDPPLDDECHNEEWTCHICNISKLTGVTDCPIFGSHSRIDCLGTDRNGSRYWFLCRRLFVEERVDMEAPSDADTVQISYYSTKLQFLELMDLLDPHLYEEELCVMIENYRDQIYEQMDITMSLTIKKKYGAKKSYLELEDAAIEKAKIQRQNEANLVLNEEKRKMCVTNDEMCNVMDGEKNIDETKTVFTDDKQVKSRIKYESPSSHTMKYGEQNGKLAMDEITDAVENELDVKLEQSDAQNEVERLKNKTISYHGGRNSLLSSSHEDSDDVYMTRRTMQRIASGTLYYKLGQEGNYRNYVNQHSTNVFAPSRTQANEERSKRITMSHKFSLTDCSAFKWESGSFSTREGMLTVIQQTFLHLEDLIPNIFMHPNWAVLRKAWIGAVQRSISPQDLARTITVLTCCIRPTVLLSVWHDSLGHIDLKRNTLLYREERKKVEKRERKEKEEEEERLKPFIMHVKYSLGLKHQLFKMKGEEYRCHGQCGWLWMSSTRVYKPTNSNLLGLSAGPHRLAVRYTDKRDGNSKIVLMEPKAFEYLVSRSEKLQELDENSPTLSSNLNDIPNIEQSKLDRALKNAMVEKQIAPDNLMQEVVNISTGLMHTTRTLYPKVAAKAAHLDDFLTRRIQLKNMEERRIGIKESSFQLQSPLTTFVVPKTEASTVEITDIGADIVISETQTPSKLSSTQVLESRKADRYLLADLLTESQEKLWKLESNGPASGYCYSTLCKSMSVKTEDDVMVPPPFYKCYSYDCITRHNSAQKVSELYSNIYYEAVNVYGLLIPKAEFEEPHSFNSFSAGINLTNKLLKVITRIKEEKDCYSAIGITPTTAFENCTLNVKKEPQPLVFEASKQVETSVGILDVASKEKAQGDEKSVLKGNVTPRLYSTSNTEGRFYLKRIQTIADAKRLNKIVKYPLAPNFRTKTRAKQRSILILAKHEVKQLARRMGMKQVQGFNYQAKSNSQAWPYICPRPTFKTAWLYRTATLNSIQTIGLQLRILWACIRWDDMLAKPPMYVEGKRQTTTDKAITTVELLRHRNIGRFLDRTQYFKRTVTIPLDVPKVFVEVEPIRSGLRKRKIAESTSHGEPKVEECWIEEDTLDLCEIRGYRDRLEREKTVASLVRTRSSTGTINRESKRIDDSYSAATPIKKQSSAQLNPINSISRSLKISNSNLTDSVTSISGGSVKCVSSSSDGMAKFVRNNIGATGLQPGTKKVFLSRDGKIVGAQVVNSTGVKVPNKEVEKPSFVLAAGPSSVTPQPMEGVQQKVQIIRSTDGKIEVTGLLPGQQLLQMPDGKLQIFSQKQGVNSPSSSVSQAKLPPSRMSLQGVVVGGCATSGSSLQLVNAATNSVVSPHVMLSPATKIQTTVPTFSASNSVPQQLAPGSQIPPNMTVFISGGKTYGISKTITTGSGVAATTQVASAIRQPLSSSISGPQTAPSKIQLSLPAASKGTKMLGFTSLGSNKVTVKGNQIIVSGPDQVEAQNIAQKLSSGELKLAQIGDKQVLLSTQPLKTEILATSQVSNSNSQSLSPHHSVSATSEVIKNVKLPTEPLPPSITLPTVPVDEPIQVTAQLIQTLNGPRIILQGIVSSDLPKDELVSIQQQVKTQLLKAQAEAKLHNKVPPTKIAIKLSASITAKIQANKKQQVTSTAPNVGRDIVHAPHSTSSLLSSTPAKISMQHNISHQIATPSSKSVLLQQTTLRHPVSITGVVPTTGSSLISTLKTPLEKTSLESNAASEKFEVTQDFINKTISDALRTKDLSPDIEQKLLSLQQHTTTNPPKLLQEVVDEDTAGDDDWQPGVFQRRKLRLDAKKQQQNSVPTSLMTTSESTAQSLLALSQQQPVVDFSQQNQFLSTNDSPPKRQLPVCSGQDEKRRRQVKLVSSLLFRQKEILKKEIAKKRAVMEKEVQIEIHREVEFHKQRATSVAEAVATTTAGTVICASSKRKRSHSDQNTPPSSASELRKSVSGSKRKRHTDNVAAVKAGIKSDKKYCICRTRYDPSKFYVGCDVCNNWFHGTCVNITEVMSTKMTEYVCEECRHAKEHQELYCLCKQPYDESQFYIGCERCEDWFHGRCVGILQVEGNQLDEYVCPKCDGNSFVNSPNFKCLDEKDYEIIKKFMKQIMSNRNSCQFKEPVNPLHVPNYYNVVKEPMDLHTVESKVFERRYEKLCDFIGDIMRIFENCRFFNVPESSIVKSSKHLELFISQKLQNIRDKLRS